MASSANTVSGFKNTRNAPNGLRNNSFETTEVYIIVRTGLRASNLLKAHHLETEIPKKILIAQPLLGDRHEEMDALTSYNAVERRNVRKHAETSFSRRLFKPAHSRVGF